MDGLRGGYPRLLRDADLRIREAAASGATKLKLSVHGLVSLPESLGQLTQRQRLDISGNQLTALPESLRRLTSLTALLLHGNDALNIPAEVLGPTSREVYRCHKARRKPPASPASILDYYFRTRWGKRPLNSPDEYRYDAFISYRRQDPDRAFAREILTKMETHGFKVAFDERDFQPHATFLDEMERCVEESRFTLAVVSPRYFESGNTEEEAVISKVIGMRERKRRVIPLILERVKMPVWLFNLVGIDFTATDALVNPYDRLRQALGKLR